jgi:mannose-6-phosphate isomerase-like protein (cupin superfamily)
MRDTIFGPDAVEWLGVRYSTILTAEQTGGALSVTDSVSSVGSGPPRHIHHDADETYVLLSGDVEFWLEGERFIRGPGSAVFIPRGKEHTFRVFGSVPSRHLVILTPGGFERISRRWRPASFGFPITWPLSRRAPRAII